MVSQAAKLQNIFYPYDISNSKVIVRLTMMNMMRSVCFLMSLFFGVASSYSFLEESNTIKTHEDNAFFRHATAATIEDQRRNLIWSFDFTPDADPAVICEAFQTASESGEVQYECSCNSVPDKSVELKCLQKEPRTCVPGDSICYLLTLNIGLNLDNAIEVIETCTEYVDVNRTALDGTNLVQANYSDIRPCVRVLPETPGDFSKLQSCSATMNGQSCYKCEICGDSDITMDCCNTNPNGEPLEVECGETASGLFAPFFKGYVEGQEGTCESSGTSWLQDIRLVLLVTLVVAVPVSFFLL